MSSKIERIIKNMCPSYLQSLWPKLLAVRKSLWIVVPLWMSPVPWQPVPKSQDSFSGAEMTRWVGSKHMYSIRVGRKFVFEDFSKINFFDIFWKFFDIFWISIKKFLKFFERLKPKFLSNKLALYAIWSRMIPAKQFFWKKNLKIFENWLK